MKKVISLLLGLVVAAAALAQSKVVTESIRSKFLGCEQKFNVYLPAGYDAARCYPVIYLLHGLYDFIASQQQEGLSLVFVGFVVLMFVMAYSLAKRTAYSDRYIDPGADPDPAWREK